MAYEQEISRKLPTCFLFLLDHSDSMSDAIGGGSGQKKAVALAELLNRTIRELCIRTQKGDDIRYYYDIGVIGYGAGKVGPALGGKLAGQELVPVTEIMPNPLRIETRSVAEAQTIKFPVWVEPTWHGDTPMCKALERARAIAKQWIDTHGDSYPPTVINITDGEATDGKDHDLTRLADQLKALSTSDGNVLLWNCHLSTKGGAEILMPSSGDALPDNYSKTLFSISSLLPDKLLNEAEDKLNVSEGARGFAYNAGLAGLLTYLDIGTRTPTMLR